MKQQLTILDQEDLKEVLTRLIHEAVNQEVSVVVSQLTNNNPLLTRNDVASMLDISMPTLNQWEKDGVIPKPKRLGKRVYWLRQPFLNFLEDC